ncbi:hypothetical protein LCGC14_1000270 [marine sediment metagenome]|uniref:Uncharacterized protein n=1 Tax=marine sediment metagenome TaxID=412755 RepID=A0A0F9QLM1_9ZZZZ
MGRGVMTEGDHIVYFDATGIEDSFDWDDMQENIMSNGVSVYEPKTE